jgi:magnesium chelatase subunit D
MTIVSASSSAWNDAVLSLAVFAVAPSAIGGIRVRAQPGPVRDRWIGMVREALPTDAPVRRIPIHATDDRLLGGLDLAASIGVGRPVWESGILASCDGGAVLLAMAERAENFLAARIAAAMDSGRVNLQGDGIAVQRAARIGVIALDEGLTLDDRPPHLLLDRLACWIDLSTVATREAQSSGIEWSAMTSAQERLTRVHGDEHTLEVLCRLASMLGIVSMRAPLLCLRVARAHAAIEGRDRIGDADLVTSARLVLAPRATQLPPAAAETTENGEQPDHPHQDPIGQSAKAAPPAVEQSTDRLVEAVMAALPKDLLDSLSQAGPTCSRAAGVRAGGPYASKHRGRPAGFRHGERRGGAQLHLLETLKAAAPWQRLRKTSDGTAGDLGSIQMRCTDLRIRRFKQEASSVTLFVVDASGSMAAQRLAEAKGAVELLLAQCYRRRDLAALLAFRGTQAKVLLPPTRSLSRAKRCLCELPGGGGTPLAAGLVAARHLAEASRRAGHNAKVVMLTDGCANVTQAGIGDRARAEAEALAAARLLRSSGVCSLLIDTSQRPRPIARDLATAMGAHYVPLPRADAVALSQVVQASRGARARSDA